MKQYLGICPSKFQLTIMQDCVEIDAAYTVGTQGEQILNSKMVRDTQAENTGDSCRHSRA